MPSQMLNRINIDTGVDTTRLQQWYDEAAKNVDQKGWSPNEGRYWKYCNDYAYRKALEDGCKKVNSNQKGAKTSRALQGLVKATLSEIESEKQGIYL